MTATAIVDELELHIPIADLIDKNAESARLQKKITKHQKDLESLQVRLQNTSFVEKAPENM